MNALNLERFAFATSLGWLGIEWHNDCVSRLTFGHRHKSDVIAVLRSAVLSRTSCMLKADVHARLLQFAAGRPTEFFDVQVHVEGHSAFQQAVWRKCRQLGWGNLTSYGMLARDTGKPGAARAVGMAMATNPIPIIIPCHRVVSSGGRRLGGFSAPGGLGLKQRMLAAEGSLADMRLEIEGNRSLVKDRVTACTRR